MTVWKLQTLGKFWPVPFCWLCLYRQVKLIKDKRDLVKDREGSRGMTRICIWVCWAGGWTLLYLPLQGARMYLKTHKYVLFFSPVGKIRCEAAGRDCPKSSLPDDWTQDLFNQIQITWVLFLIYTSPEVLSKQNNVCLSPYVSQMLSRPCLRCRKLFIGHIVTRYHLDWNQTAPVTQNCFWFPASVYAGSIFNLSSCANNDFQRKWVTPFLVGVLSCIYIPTQCSFCWTKHDNVGTSFVLLLCPCLLAVHTVCVLFCFGVNNHLFGRDTIT